MSNPDVTLNEVTHLLAHIVLGDSGIGGWPLDGELVLFQTWIAAARSASDVQMRA